MTFKIATATPSSAVATSGTIALSYPAGTSAGDFATYGHRANARGLQFDMSQAAGDFSLAFGASDITFTYLGLTSIPANTLVTVQLNQRGEDERAPYNRSALMNRMAESKLYRIDLGSPATADADGAVLSQSATAANGLATGINGALASGGVATFDAPRNVVAAWTGTSVLTVTGTDEYGNTVVESSASGTSLTGKKAFKTITAVAVSVDVTSLTIGTGVVLGLPVFVEDAAQILEEYEDNAPLKRGPAEVNIPWQVDQVDLLAPTPISFASPVDGVIAELTTMAWKAVTIGGTVTMNVNNVAVDGLSVVVANGGGAGDLDSDIPTAGHASTVVAVDDELELIFEAAFATAGALTGNIRLTSTALQQLNGTGVMGVLTAPTALTGDVRGTYNPTTVPDGATAFSMLIALPDPTFKGADNFAG